MSRLVNYTCPDHGKFQHRVTCGYGSGPAPKEIHCPSGTCPHRARRTKIKVYRRSLSLPAAVYDRLLAYCKTQEVSMESVIDALTQDLGRTA